MATTRDRNSFTHGVSIFHLWAVGPTRLQRGRPRESVFSIRVHSVQKLSSAFSFILYRGGPSRGDMLHEIEADLISSCLGRITACRRRTSPPAPSPPLPPYSPGRRHCGASLPAAHLGTKSHSVRLVSRFGRLGAHFRPQIRAQRV